MTSRATRSFDAIDPSSYLTVATDLAREQNAAAIRSAIDRAYYAAMLTARDQLTEKGYRQFTRGPEAHAQVVNALKGIAKEAAETLRMLRQARNRLTYQPGRQVLPRGQSLRQLLEGASIVIEAVRALPVNA